MRLQFKITDENQNYVEASARLRDVSPEGLLCRVLHAALDGQLILAILDDGDEPKVCKKRHGNTKGLYPLPSHRLKGK